MAHSICFPKIEGLTDSFNFCRRLLEETRVGLAPGVAFGTGGRGVGPDLLRGRAANPGTGHGKDRAVSGQVVEGQPLMLHG